MYRTPAWIITSLVSFSFVTIQSSPYRRFPTPKFRSISPRSPFPGFLPFQLLLLFLDRQISIGFPEFLTVQVNASLLAVLHVSPGSEDLVCKDSFGVVPVGSSIHFSFTSVFRMILSASSVGGLFTHPDSDYGANGNIADIHLAGSNITFKTDVIRVIG